MELHERYARQRAAIEARLGEFAALRAARGEALYAELCFCLLTPQSHAKRCWGAVMELRQQNLLMDGDLRTIASVLQTRTRFHQTKADNIVRNRTIIADLEQKLASEHDGMIFRDWLIANVRGFGLKEASHFLRNVGFVDVAILDRHILRCLVRHGAIEALPKTMTAQRYRAIEEQMKAFAEKKDIPLAHLDLLFWHEANGEIFK